MLMNAMHIWSNIEQDRKYARHYCAKGEMDESRYIDIHVDKQVPKYDIPAVGI